MLRTTLAAIAALTLASPAFALPHTVTTSPYPDKDNDAVATTTTAGQNSTTIVRDPGNGRIVRVITTTGPGHATHTINVGHECTGSHIPSC